jgi:hypothetical protein
MINLTKGNKMKFLPTKSSHPYLSRGAMQFRIYEIAKIVDLDSKEVRNYCKIVGLPNNSASCKISYVEGMSVISRLKELKKDFAPLYLSTPF